MCTFNLGNKVMLLLLISIAYSTRSLRTRWTPVLRNIPNVFIKFDCFNAVMSTTI